MFVFKDVLFNLEMLWTKGLSAHVTSSLIVNLQFKKEPQQQVRGVNQNKVNFIEVLNPTKKNYFKNNQMFKIL